MPQRLDLRHLSAPIVQAGMGPIARHELAAAVSDAGGLGTIGGARAPIAAELAAARRLTGQPIAVNLLLPLLRPGDAEAAADADAIVTFWGEPRRLADCTWIHQCGSVSEAHAAATAGADAVIAQGVEAGGHVRGTSPLLELLALVRSSVRIPVLAAGGIVDADGVRAALDAGAVAAVVGTRFLLTEESRAHPDYKRRCLDADTTVLTELFGLGWPDAPHRVVPNAATRRWLGNGGRGADDGTGGTGGDRRGPGWIRAANRLTQPLASRLPASFQARALKAQRASSPFLAPQPPTDDGPVNLVDSGPLYAGAQVARITDMRPARELVQTLTR
jgi:NAD(P)H-dependent flavin oxidoreductase YrpB (nitropropane dioxygenase family)